MEDTTQPAPAPSVAQAETATERPDWLDETPKMDYGLVVMGPDDEAQNIEVTIEEYDLLKVHLARLRGFGPPETQTEGMFLDACREIYEARQGANAPAGDALRELLVAFSTRPLEIEDFQAAAQKFGENLADAVAIAKRIQQDRPGMLAG